MMPTAAVALQVLCNALRRWPTPLPLIGDLRDLHKICTKTLRAAVALLRVDKE